MKVTWAESRIREAVERGRQSTRDSGPDELCSIPWMDLAALLDAAQAALNHRNEGDTPCPSWPCADSAPSTRTTPSGRAPATAAGASAAADLRAICSGCDQRVPGGCWCLVIEAIESELNLAHSGEGYEARPVAEEIVQKYVGPLLAAKDRELDRMRAERPSLINDRDELVPTHHARDVQFERAERLKRERDEARAKAEQMHLEKCGVEGERDAADDFAASVRDQLGVSDEDGWANVVRARIRDGIEARAERDRAVERLAARDEEAERYQRQRDYAREVPDEVTRHLLPVVGGDWIGRPDPAALADVAATMIRHYALDASAPPQNTATLGWQMRQWAADGGIPAGRYRVHAEVVVGDEHRLVSSGIPGGEKVAGLLALGPILLDPIQPDTDTGDTSCAPATAQTASATAPTGPSRARADTAQGDSARSARPVSTAAAAADPADPRDLGGA